MDFMHDQLALGTKFRALAIVDAFNGKFRTGCLSAHWFMSPDDANEKREASRSDYYEVTCLVVISRLEPVSSMRDAPGRRKQT